MKQEETPETAEDNEHVDEDLIIGLVGPCTSGKSVLREKLQKRGYKVKHIAQEHSFVQDMWKKLVNPDVLVFLDVSFPTTLQRRSWDWQEADYAEQQRRLAHARQHADLYLHTDELSPDEVFEQVLRFLLAL